MSEVFVCTEGHQWNPSPEGSSPAAGQGVACPVCGAEGWVDSTEDLIAPLTDPDGELPPLPGPVPAVVTKVAAEMLLSPRHPVAVDRPAIAGYEILGQVGRGGMGLVYLAVQQKLKRAVALKVILAGAHAEPEQRARFRTEAEAAARFQHPNIVQVYEVGEQEGYPYLALEFVEGGSLAQKLAGTPEPAPEAARLVEALARAVHFAHERGVVHRDLKPANVLLTADGTPKITDFGLAKQMHGELGADAAAGQTKTGQILGTPGYMAPEQADRPSREVGPAADIYALGAILYECLTGRPPFRAETPLATVQQAQSEEPVPLRRLLPAIPRDLETVCLKCLHKEPRGRYASAAALADDLRRFLGGEPVAARPTPAWERAWKWARRNPAAASAGLVGGLAVVLLLGTLAVSNVLIRQEQHRAEENARTAEARRAQAERYFRQARDAVDHMLTRVGEVQLAHVPQLEPVRRALLEEALTYYQGFLEERGDDPALRLETGRAYARVVTIRRQLGQSKEAASASAAAITLLEKLAAEHPSEPVYRQELALAHSAHGVLLSHTSRPLDAEPAFRRALRLRQDLAAEHPGAAEHRRNQAASLLSLGNLLAVTGRRPDAEQALREALAIEDQLVKDFPDVPSYRWGLAGTHTILAILHTEAQQFAKAEEAAREAARLYDALAKAHPQVPRYRQLWASSQHNLGLSLADLARLDDAEQAHRAALPVQERLVREFPHVPGYRHEQAHGYASLGTLLWSAGRAGEAEETHRKALAILEQLVTTYPDVPDYECDLGGSLHNVALIHIQRAEWAEARSLLERALRYQQAALRANPRQPKYRQFLRNHTASLADTLVHLGDHAAAAQQAAEGTRLFPERPGEFSRVARVLAHCVPLAAADAKLPAARRQELAEEYAAQAVAHLRQAVLKGFKDSKWLRTDGAFAPLRSRTDFQKLLSGLEEGAKTGSLKRPNETEAA